MLLQELSVKGCTMGEFRQQLAKTSAAFREAQMDMAARNIQKWAAYAQAMSAWEGCLELWKMKLGGRDRIYGTGVEVEDLNRFLELFGEKTVADGELYGGISTDTLLRRGLAYGAKRFQNGLDG
jgi:hypothetical protein